MKYTERDFDFEYNSLQDWIRSSAALFIVAPLRLINEISSKIIYLNKNLINKVLHLAVLMSLISLGVYSGVHLWLGDFSWYLGKIPVVLQIACCAVLVGIDCWYNFYGFIIYEHVDKLLPIVTSTSDTTPAPSNIEEQHTVGGAAPEEASLKYDKFSDLESSILTELDTINLPSVEPIDSSADIDKLTEKLNMDFTTEHQTSEHSFKSNSIDLDFIDDDLLAILNDDLLDDDTTISYQETVTEELQQLNTIEEPELEKEMDNSTDPSKYVNEDGLFRFLANMGAESFGEFDIFSSYKAPDDFNLTA